MPRLLQLISHWSKRTGEVTVDQFERVLHTLGVRYTAEQVSKLFRVLDADANGKVSLEELLLLKFAIDNDITELPARPSLDDDPNVWQQHNVVLKIDWESNHEGSLATWGFFQLLRPILGVLWKADIRPHHALDFAKNARKHTHYEQRVAQAELSVCHVLSEGWRVKLALSPHPDVCISRPKVHISRERYVYQAGPVGPAAAFYDEMQKEISLAAEEACDVLGALLSEVRQMDLKLEEVRLMTRGGDTADIGGQEVRRQSGESLSRLKHLLAAFHADVQDCLISQTRYTHSNYNPTELVGCPRTVRYQAELVRVEGYTRWRKGLAFFAAVLLGVTAFLYFCISVSLGEPYYTNHRVCEFQHLACSTRGALYRCLDGSPCDRGCPDAAVYEYHHLTNMTLETLKVVQLDWATNLLGRPCDPSRMGQSYAWCVPLPLLFFSSVVLPVGLFHNNAHKTTVIKVLVWTPVVPLVILQCIIRSCILLSIIADSADVQFAQIFAAESIVVTGFVAVFLFMDAMRHPTPLLRIALAICLCIRFLSSVMSRAIYKYPAEQWPLLLEGPLRDAFMGVGSATKQSTIASIDWTITLMLFSSVLSVLNYPGEMAVVRMRCDTKGYFNWRDQYLGAMNIRAHRRDLNVADRYLWFQSKVDRIKEQVSAHSSRAKQYAQAKLANIDVPSFSQLGAQMPTRPGRGS